MSNKTYYRPTNPKTRISVKPGKARTLNYLCNLAVDTTQGVINPVQADLIDSRNNLPQPLDYALARFSTPSALGSLH